MQAFTDLVGTTAVPALSINIDELTELTPALDTAAIDHGLSVEASEASLLAAIPLSLFPTRYSPCGTSIRSIPMIQAFTDLVGTSAVPAHAFDIAELTELTPVLDTAQATHGTAEQASEASLGARLSVPAWQQNIGC
jgi:hypothetical protein